MERHFYLTRIERRRSEDGYCDLKKGRGRRRSQVTDEVIRVQTQVRKRTEMTGKLQREEEKEEEGTGGEANVVYIKGRRVRRSLSEDESSGTIC